MDKNSVCKTPPMGWNSWDCLATTATEAQLLENAEYMREHMSALGWEYIVCDAQWYEPFAGTGEDEYRPFAPLEMDGFGRLMPASNRFPSAAGGKGFAEIARRIHGMGLKFGLHLMRGIPRQAVYARLPVLGTDLTADQIANPFSISKWNGDMYGLNACPGAQAYYDSVFALFAEWGVDYVKVDDICNTNMYKDNPYSGKAEIEMIRAAMDGFGRPMVLSLSPGPAVIEESWHLKKHANMWRITDDFWDSWHLLLDMFRRCDIWQSHVSEGCWPDCDMLPLGHIGMGFGKPRLTNFTPDEQRTLMTLWCIFRSPLMMGGYLPDNDAFTLGLLTNAGLLAMHREGRNARQLSRRDDSAVWRSDAPDGVYIALFNLSDSPLIMPLPGELSGCAVTDLWTGKPLTAREITLPPHGSAALHGKK